MEHLVHNGLREHLDGLQLLLGQTTQALHRLFELFSAHALGFRTHRSHGGHDFHRLQPRLERRHLLVDDPLGEVCFFHALLEIRRDDPAEIVDVVEVDVGEIGTRGIDVTRQGDVDEEQRVALAVHGLHQQLLGDHELRSGSRRDHDVDLTHALEELVVGNRFAPEALGEFDGALVGAIRHKGALHAVAQQVLGGELAHLPGTQDKYRAALEILEDALGELDGCITDRDGVLTDLGLCAHPLAHLEAVTEQLVEDPAGSATGKRVVVGFFDLTQDLRLAQDHRVQRGNHPEEVLDDGLALRDVEVAHQLMAVEVMVVGHEVDDGVGPVEVRLGDGVDLRAVARRENDRLRDGLRLGETSECVLLAVRREGQLLAYLYRCGFVAQADKGQMHVCCARLTTSIVTPPQRSDVWTQERPRRKRCVLFRQAGPARAISVTL